MSYEELRPSAALRPFVDRLWTSTSGPTSEPRRILPDGCIDVLIDAVRGEALVVGTMTRASVLQPVEATRIVAVRFRPGGAFPFLRVPVAELTDRVVDAGALGLRWLEPHAIAERADATASAPRDAARALEERLLAHVSSLARPDAIVAHAARAMFGGDPPSVASLERETGWSRQHLARMFQRHVGVGPKMLARVARLQRAVQHLQRPAMVSLADAAVELGYFDQAHMALDFRELAGVPPRAVAAARGSIFPIPSLAADRWSGA